MKERDWLFYDGDKTYNFRTTGVLIQNGKILIQRGVNDIDYALPGGQVAWGETSAEALMRE
jgi:ADP-ribose pyrophosphatase YjhB (NUDIX family)